MGFNCGIIGLPNVGKSTIFNALCENAKAEASNYPFCTIEPNKGIVRVPDERIDKLAEIVKPERTIYPTMEFVDIAGLVKGASKGEGLGNQFLSHIRTVDALIHVVRCFEDENISHVEGKIDPLNDIEIVNLELILADLETLEKRISKIEKQAKSGDKKLKKELDFLYKIYELLKNEKFAIEIKPQNEDEKNILKSLNLLTAKPVLYLANVDEDSIHGNEYTEKVKDFAKKTNSKFLIICGKVEAEINELSKEEREEFLNELGIQDTALNKLIKEGYSLLDLITFFTILSNEVKGWTIKKGTKAPQAAGKIHKDFEKGFIKAEVINFEDFIKTGSEQKCRELGLIRIEGKDYIVNDGDIIHFRFNV